jgi:hypothetical protein
MTRSHFGDLVRAFLFTFCGRVRIRTAADAVRIIITCMYTRVYLKSEPIFSTL